MKLYQMEARAITEGCITVKARNEEEAKQIAQRIFWDDDHIGVDMDNIGPTLEILSIKELDSAPDWWPEEQYD